DADGVYRRIGGAGDLERLIVGQFAERVEARADDDDGFPSFNIFHAVDGESQSVPQVDLAESRDSERVERSAHFVAVLGEVLQDVRLHIEIDHRNPVFRLHEVQEPVRVLERQVKEGPPVIGEFNHQADGHGGFSGAEIGYGLRDPVVVDLEIRAT